MERAVKDENCPLFQKYCNSFQKSIYDIDNIRIPFQTAREKAFFPAPFPLLSQTAR